MTWKNPAVWDAMVKGESCPFCDDIHLEENRFSFLVSETARCFVRLPKNQYLRGWVIVALKRHATELFHLDDAEHAEFWRDVKAAAAAVAKVFSPIKVNYAIYGNLCPHLHCHVLPRYPDDDPHEAVKIDQRQHHLTADDYRTRIGALKKALAPESVR